MDATSGRGRVFGDGLQYRWPQGQAWTVDRLRSLKHHSPDLTRSHRASRTVGLTRARGDAYARLLPMQIEGLSKRSILYVSATVHPDHELHGTMRRLVDPLPDMDLGRVVESSGKWIRDYFVEKVIDGTKDPLP